MKIFGAGMAGLLAANMLRRYEPVVYEAQEVLPDNHGALLRFRSDIVARATGIPFRRVNVTKAICYGDTIITTPNLKLSNMYARKVIGEVTPRSITNLDTVTRYIAPDTFIADLARSCKVECGAALVEPQPCISTIPMPMLMDIVGWKDRPDFRWRAIWSLTATIKQPRVDVYQTLYYPGQEPFYRASLTGNKLTIELLAEVRSVPEQNWFVQCVLEQFGLARHSDVSYQIHPLKYQKFGKLLPIDERARRRFIVAMSDTYGIYSIGRFATWRQILLDDVVNDVGVVERFWTDRDQYSRIMLASQ